MWCTVGRETFKTVVNRKFWSGSSRPLKGQGSTSVTRPLIEIRWWTIGVVLRRCMWWQGFSNGQQRHISKIPEGDISDLLRYFYKGETGSFLWDSDRLVNDNLLTTSMTPRISSSHWTGSSGPPKSWDSYLGLRGGVKGHVYRRRVRKWKGSKERRLDVMVRQLFL